MKKIIHFSKILVHWLTVVSLVFSLYLFPSSALSATNVNPTITTLGPTSLVNGSYGTDTTPGPFTFVADDVDNGDQVKYEIQISTSSSFSPKVVDYTSDFVQHSSLPMTFSFTVGQDAGTGTYTTGSAGQTLAEDSYYWRLKAFDNHAGSSNYVAANSGLVAFRIDLTAPTIGTITGTTGTTGENTAVSVSATGSPTSAQISVNGGSYTAMSGSSSPFTYNVPVPSSSTSSISYIVKVYDAAGNFATSSTKTITVTDNDSPVIGTISSAPDTTGESSTITVTAADNISPTSAQINIAGTGYVAMTGSTSPFIYSQPIPSNSISAISYTVKVFDAAGLFATSGTQTINPTDNDKPVITLNGSTPVTIQVNSAYVDAGATAKDNVNGTITSSIITSNPVNSNVIGDYTVTYNVTDSAGNPADQVSRLVHVVDTTKPTISLIGVNPQTIEVNTVYSELGSTVSDNYDTGLVATVDTSGLNMNVVGAYIIHYNATDSSANTATQVDRTVNVVDTTKPVITLIGSSPITIEVHGTYTELGASVSDNYDATTTATITGSVDVNTVGIYTLHYNYTDANSNAADQVDRIINVVDTTKPTITLLGTTPISVEVNTSYIDAGATANDNYDGNVTSGIVTVNPVNINSVGVYTVTYNVTDANTNTADQVTRTVNVVDTTKPVITLIGITPTTVEVHGTYTELGASVTDNYDAATTATVSGSVDVNTVGTYTLHYNYTDANDNSADQVDRTVSVVDTTKPAISRLGDASVTTEVFSPYSDAGATATDNYDNDITSSIVTFNPVNVNVVGVYTVTYDVSDSNGNIADQVTRTVNVVDATKPVITLNGSSNLTVEYLSVYTDQGATATDNYDSNLTSNIVVVNPVNTNILGDYLVTYSVSDSSGNVADQVARTIHVVDTTSPITPPSVGGTSGDNSITLTWDAVADAVSYEVRYRPSSSTDVDDYQNVVVTSLNIDYISLSTPVTTTTISGLIQGTEYEFGVRAKDTSNNLSSWTVFKKSTTTPITSSSSNNSSSNATSTSTSSNSNSSVTTSTKTTVPNKSTTSTSNTQPVSTDPVTATVSPSADLPPTASTVDNPTSDSSGQVKGLETQSSGSKNRNIIIYSLVFLAGIALYFIYKRRRANSSQLY